MNAGRVSRARAHFEAAASRGHGKALRKLAIMDASGMTSRLPNRSDTSEANSSIPASNAASLALYHLAAVHGDTEAQLTLAHRYHKGIGGAEHDCETAAFYYAAVADKSHEEHIRGGSEQIHEHKLLTAKGEDEGIDKGEKGEDDELIEYQRLRAEEGHLPSIIAMGDLYYYGGHGLARDQTRALQYFQQAANAPHFAESGQVACGNMFLKGEGTEKNLTEAMGWYEKAATKNNTRALNGLAYLYYHGDKDGGLEVNRTKAFNLFLRAANAKKTDGDSLFNAGHCLWEGEGTERNRGRAIGFFQRAAREFGHFGSAHRLGIAHLSGQGFDGQRNCKESLNYLVPAARHGSWGNVVRKGFNRYMSGDMAGAAVRYLEGGEMGYIVAHSNVAYLLDSGRLSAEDIDTTWMALTSSSNQDASKSSINSNALAHSGQDMGLRQTLALHFYNLAKDGGSSAHDRRLGDYYYYGYGGLPRSLTKAAQLYRLASSAGDAEASYSLAVMYADGEISATSGEPENGMNGSGGKRMPGPAEEILAEKYFSRCLELDPSAEVRVAVELAMARIALEKKVNAWERWWKEGATPFVTLKTFRSIENYSISAALVALTLIIVVVAAKQRSQAASTVEIVESLGAVTLHGETDVDSVPENGVPSSECDSGDEHEDREQHAIHLIFDTDIGDDIDDAFALALALNLHREGRVKLLYILTSGFGNHHKRAGLIGRLQLAIFGDISVPIVLGDVSGESNCNYMDLGSTSLPPDSVFSLETKRIEIREVVNSSTHNVTFLCLGTLHSLLTLNLKTSKCNLVLMGGCFGKSFNGIEEHIAEYNVRNDYKSWKCVLERQWADTLVVPLDVAGTCRIPSTLWSKFLNAKTSCAIELQNMYNKWYEANVARYSSRHPIISLTRNKKESSLQFDSCALFCCFSSMLNAHINTKKCSIRIESDGKTYFSGSTNNVRVAYEWRAGGLDYFCEWFMQKLMLHNEDDCIAKTEDDRTIQEMIQIHLAQLRQYQISLRATLRAKQLNISTHYGRPYLSNPKARSRQFDECKRQFKNNALKKYLLKNQKKLSFQKIEHNPDATESACIILICGPSGCGKSSLADELVSGFNEYYSSQCCKVIHQDDYFTQDYEKYSDRRDDSFETAEHIDWSKLRYDIMIDRTINQVLLVEGHQIASEDANLRPIANAVIVFEGQHDISKQRRLERRTRDEADYSALAAYFDAFVWPAYLKYGKPAQDALKSECYERGCLVYSIEGNDTRTSKQLAQDVLLKFAPHICT